MKYLKEFVFVVGLFAGLCLIEYMVLVFVDLLSFVDRFAVLVIPLILIFLFLWIREVIKLYKHIEEFDDLEEKNKRTNSMHGENLQKIEDLKKENRNLEVVNHNLQNEMESLKVTRYHLGDSVQADYGAIKKVGKIKNIKTFRGIMKYEVEGCGRKLYEYQHLIRVEE